MEIRRAFLLTGGLTMMGLGLVGTVLPLLPATPFFLAAAWFFSRSSPRLERWLLNLPVVGGQLDAWRRHRTIGMGAKLWAVGTIGLCGVLIVQTSGLPSVVNGLALLAMFVVITFIWSRPSPPR
jgi:uncharacterized membrane protein YbaN (DUF454 family)